MQLEAHRVQDTQNGFEIWMRRIAFKGTIDRRSFKPGYFGNVRNIVKTRGPANGMTNFGDIRLLERFIYETPRPLIGSPLVGWSPAGRSF